MKKDILVNRKQIYYTRFMKAYHAGEYNDLNLEMSEFEYSKLKKKSRNVDYQGYYFKGDLPDYEKNVDKESPFLNVNTHNNGNEIELK